MIFKVYKFGIHIFFQLQMSPRNCLNKNTNKMSSNPTFPKVNIWKISGFLNS